ncbi:hypothetical protein CJF30_00008722 [Rutstroemia sp. NJR-2017a BBW]|nr:hypothetical protein CJF30_00008722 [Rutstroemia sp. NJR-2017a BBW]
MGIGKWKHEEPLELQSESEIDTETESPPPTFSIFGVPQKPPQQKARRPKSDDERRQIAERRAIRKRNREALRPYYQFIYQISMECERTQDESANGEGADAADINTRAYETSRTPGQSEEFGTEDGVYYLGCHGSMNGLLRRKPPTTLHLFQRTRSRTAAMTREKRLLYVFLGLLLPLNIPKLVLTVYFI